MRNIRLIALACHSDLLHQLLVHNTKQTAVKSYNFWSCRTNAVCRFAHTSSTRSGAAVPTVSAPALAQQTRSDSPQQQLFAFDNHKLAYGHRSVPYLLRAYFVLQLCRMQRLTQNASRWAKFGARVLGQRLFGTIMKASFFGHFTGAEDTHNVRQCVKTLYSVHKIRPILHYHAERELGECETAQQRAEAVKWNAELTIESIKIVSEAAPDAFAALKITAFFDPQVLAKLTSTVMTTRLLRQIADSNNSDMDPLQAKQLLETITTGNEQPAHVMVFKMLQNLVKNCPRLSLTDLSILNSNTNFLPDHSALFYQHVRPGTFNSGEQDEFLASWQRLVQVLDTARQLNVRLFVDAEQTWLQPAIGQFALLAMQRCNSSNAPPRVWGTLQCYLKNAEQTYREYNDIAQRENFTFATKFVRGAYIRSETDRAKAMQYDCSIWPTYEATNESYDRLADIALRSLVDSGDGLRVTFATHNEKSIDKIVKQMRQMNIDPTRVAFGQLYGMCDRITYDLARSGFTTLKVVPYGPIPLLTPYFVRRAEENSLMLGRCEKDLKILKMELAHRLLPSRNARRAAAVG